MKILSDAEMTIITFLCEGIEPNVCSEILKIDIKLVSLHKRNAMGKLGVRTNQKLFSLYKKLKCCMAIHK